MHSKTEGVCKTWEYDRIWVNLIESSVRVWKILSSTSWEEDQEKLRRLMSAHKSILVSLLACYKLNKTKGLKWIESESKPIHEIMTWNWSEVVVSCCLHQVRDSSCGPLFRHELRAGCDLPFILSENWFFLKIEIYWNPSAQNSSLTFLSSRGRKWAAIGMLHNYWVYDHFAAVVKMFMMWIENNHAAIAKQWFCTSGMWKCIIVVSENYLFFCTVIIIMNIITSSSSSSSSSSSHRHAPPHPNPSVT